MSCGIFGLKETNEPLMVSRVLLMSSKHILQTLFDWMHALDGIPSMSFVDFIDSLLYSM